MSATTYDTIAAIATAPGRGGIGIVRVSGPGCRDVARELVGDCPKPRVAALRSFVGANGEGLRHTSGRECLPLPICIGQLLQIHETRPPGEIAGFYMLRGGAPCVSDAYMGYFERFLAEQG